MESNDKYFAVFSFCSMQNQKLYSQHPESVLVRNESKFGVLQVIL